MFQSSAMYQYENKSKNTTSNKTKVKIVQVVLLLKVSIVVIEKAVASKNEVAFHQNFICAIRCSLSTLYDASQHRQELETHIY